MTQEEKDILIKDLCARLPYKVIVDYAYNAFNVRKGNYVEHGSKCFLNCDLLDVFKSPRQNEKGEYIKPYLFPLSSMTEEQEKECQQIKHSYYFDDDSFVLFDWYNKNHLDYRGLIPMGLANDATNLNIYRLWNF